MANPIWVTPAGSIGLVPENEFFQIPLQVTNNLSSALTFTRLAGDLPPGIQVVKSGFIQGTPIVTDVINTDNKYTFSVRARNAQGQVTDRTFSLTITNIIPPRITPRERLLGEVFDGEYLEIQLSAAEVNPEATLEWRVQNGSLPEGVSLDTATGLISGFIYPLPTEGSAGLSGYEETRFNQYGYDNSRQFRNKTYTFTVTVFDGANRDTLTYNLNVIAKSNYRADAATGNSINTTYLTVDTTNQYLPFMTTQAQELPEIRSGSNFAFKFEATDPEDNFIGFALTAQSGVNFDASGVGFDTQKFDQSGLSIPPGLSIDAATGWMTGFIPLQAAVSETYTFEVYPYRLNDPAFAGATVTYTLTVLGDINNTITWTTASNLGAIDNGSVSEFSISAVSNAGKTLLYRLTDGSKLPQGLKLLPSGLISGRASFEYFSIDSGSTTIDGKATTFDDTYTFVVQAQDFAETVSDVKTFTIAINNYNILPYENLYITALPKMDERRLFQSIVNNTDIFPSELIYRPTDPWFGRAKNIRSLFLAGINPMLASRYIAAMGTNHFTKSIEFGTVKTARAVDKNFNVKYEVVYLDLTDTLTRNSDTPASSVDLTGSINPWYDVQGNGYSVVYPNGFNNMTQAVVDSIGYSHEGALPDWMTSPQENNKPLGFVNAVVLAYTVPGASKLMAYRVNTQGLVFNTIDFVVDRYQLDNHLSTNFNVSINSFISSVETTWDRITKEGVIRHSAAYAVSGIPFDNINGQTVNHVRSLGGLDGVTSFQDGDTLIFLQQEDYSPVSNPFIINNVNEGWNYPDGSVVPGFVEKDRGLSVVNYRAGVWRVTITTPDNLVIPTQSSDFGNDLVGFDTRQYDFSIDWDNPPAFPTQLVTLEFVEEVIPGEQVQINGGTTRGQSIVFYDPTLHVNRSVPEYIPVTYQTGVVQTFTKFDNNGTKFFNHRDTYSVPESNNKYLKFPKIGVFK
jgi:hypothetical protein